LLKFCFGLFSLILIIFLVAEAILSLADDQELDKLKSCFEALQFVLDSVLEHPNDPTFSGIDIHSDLFRQRFVLFLVCMNLTKCSLLL
jgi:hypothetical protein